ncbi:MAG: GGDEF domain-containing protein [Candidatus Hydrogenedentes bacterium]|nr:GGDEF domain-containing protein [Candidatus Hydrogenedentota bacterium]
MPPVLTAAWIYRVRKRILAGVLGCTLVTVLLTGFLLRDRLLRDAVSKSEELSSALVSSLSGLMLARDPERIQTTVEQLTAGRDSILKALILDREGRVVYSSDPSERGRKIDTHTEASCRVCHLNSVLPKEHAVITVSEGEPVQRVVTVIANQAACHACHPAENPVNGKLIVDRSLKKTNALIATVEAIIAACGLGSLIVLLGLVRGGVNKYVGTIAHQTAELASLYTLVERLSKTIDVAQLNHIVIDILQDVFSAEEVHLISMKDAHNFRYRLWTRSRAGIERKKLEADDPLYPVVQLWLDGRILEVQFTEDRQMVRMPIVREKTLLALAVVRKSVGTFQADDLRLVIAMAGHIASAFENARLYRLAITDELTGAYTRRHLNYCLEEKLTAYDRKAEPFALLFLDVDNFKSVNDQFGHATGDAVLRSMVHNVSNVVRDLDQVFRYGGEEFAILLPGVTVKTAREVAERIREQAQRGEMEDVPSGLRVTVSIGLAHCPDHAQTANELLFLADKALYEAKRAGRNRVATP